MEPNSQQTLSRYVAGEIPDVTDLQAETLYAAGYAFYEQNDYARAADVFRLLALARPHSPRSWIALAATHESAGDLERAMALYGIGTQTREAKPFELAAAFVNLARIEHLLGADDEARVSLDRAIELGETSDLDETTAIAIAALGRALGSGR
jgi:Flp pilus assembly protein TadD